jgi:hypothetical protein
VSHKKKKKTAGQNLSLSERLERHWKSEKWESFFSLYMRDRDVSERGPWAARFPDAMCNCLTAALFLHKNYAGARQVAEMMLSERSLGPDGDVLRACARTALDFINIRDGRSPRPSDGEGSDIALPAPYGELREKLADVFAPLKRGRQRKVSNPTVEKLSKQFKALPSAKNSGPYTSFLKTAETLLLETKETGQATIFKAVLDIASIMRETARSASDIRDPYYIVSCCDSADYPLRGSHPALLTLWEYMCKMWGRKFGGDLENAARAARMSLMNLNEEFRPAYVKMMDIELFSGENLSAAAERSYDRWTEQERFILIFLALSGHLGTNRDAFEDIPMKTILRWFKTLSEIGKKRRSGGAWPMSVRLAFEKLIVVCDIKYIDSLSREDLPLECMTAPTIIMMALCSPHALGRVKNGLGPRLPLSVDDRDRKIIRDFSLWTVFPVQALRAVCELLDAKGRELFFTTVVTSIIREDVSRAMEYKEQRATLWSSMSQSHIALFAENLPEDSQVAAFCRLCLGQKHMCLSDDPSRIAAFFSSRREDDPLCASRLSLFLMLWQSVSVEFLLRLFEDSLDGHERISEWEEIPKFIFKIQSLKDRKDVARGVSLILKRKYRNRMNSGLKLALKALDTLEKSGRLPEKYDSEPDDFDIYEKDIFNRLKRLFKKI